MFSAYRISPFFRRITITDEERDYAAQQRASIKVRTVKFFDVAMSLTPPKAAEDQEAAREEVSRLEAENQARAERRRQEHLAAVKARVSWAGWNSRLFRF
jgi:hypothetical protein